MNRLSAYTPNTERVAIYVPTTLGTRGEAPQSLIDASIAESVRIMSELFGGATITDGRGAWTANDGGMAEEAVHIVYSYAAKSDLTDDVVDAIVELAEDVQRRQEQEAVALEVSGAMYFIA